MLTAFLLFLAFALGWILRALYASKVFPPRSTAVEVPAFLRERTIGRADERHYWQEDGGVWEAWTDSEKSQARMRVVSLRNHGVHPPRRRWWQTIF